MCVLLSPEIVQAGAVKGSIAPFEQPPMWRTYSAVWLPSYYDVTHAHETIAHKQTSGVSCRSDLARRK